MNSLVSYPIENLYHRPQLRNLLNTNKEVLSKAEGIRIKSNDIKHRDLDIVCLLKRESMFGRSNTIGSNAVGRNDEGNSSNFQRHSASNLLHHSFTSYPALISGTTGLIAGSSTTSQQQSNPSLPAQTQAMAQQQQQQQRLLQMTKNELEVQQMASNIKESLLIKQRLESIQHLQQQEGNKLRAELHLKAASRVAANGIGSRSSSIGSASHGLISTATKPIPSTSNSSVLPSKQREDEMTKPDLSTLAETAVAVASATNNASVHSRTRSGIMGIDNIIKMNGASNTGNDRIAALLGRQAGPTASSKKRLMVSESLISQSTPSSITRSIASNAMTDSLRRDLNVTRDKINLESNYKRSLDEMAKNNSTRPSSSSWLWKSASVGGTAALSLEQLRAQHDHRQRRNSLPAPASNESSEFSSLRSLKRQRLLEQKSHETGGLELHDAMKRVKQLDATLSMQRPNSSSLTSNASFLSEMASKISQERRASIASSIVSIGTSATAPNLTTNSALSSPVNGRGVIIPNMKTDVSSNVFNKVSKMGGGFPMPKFVGKSSNSSESINTGLSSINSKIPAHITPELDKEVVDIMSRGTLSLSLKHQLEKDQQSRYLERIGGFPMPPLYRHEDDNHTNNKKKRQYDGSVTINDQGTRSNNAISSHIRNNVNRSSAKVSRPPTLESYKRVWSNIRAVVGEDPQIDEQLRREVFARKLHRGEILITKSHIINNANDRNANSYVQQRRVSELSVSVHSGGGSRNNDPANEESIII